MKTKEKETQEILEKLKKLQDILLKKYTVEDKLREEPKQVNQYNALLEQTQKKYIDKNAEYESVKSRIYTIRTDLDAAVKALESGEKGMDNIATHREYEALKIQITEATEKEKSLRESLKREEKILSEMNESLDLLKGEIDAYEGMISESKKDIDKNLDSYNKELRKLQNEIDKITPSLDPEIVFKFERIIRRNSEGIVAVRGYRGGYGVCTGCHMILPAQFVNEVHEGKNIDFCPYCSRILFYEESSEQDDIYNLDEAGSLIDDDDDIFDEDEDDQDDDGMVDVDDDDDSDVEDNEDEEEEEES